MSNTTTRARDLARELQDTPPLLQNSSDYGESTERAHAHRIVKAAKHIAALLIAALLIALSDENAKLLDALVGMVAQHCAWHDGLLHDNALSADEDAIDVLMNMGAIRMVSEKPLAYDWIPQQEAAP